MSLGIKSIFLVAKSEYVKWLRNPRFLLVLAASVPVHELIVRPMIRAAGEMEQPLNMFETSIAVANSGFALLLFPLIYLVLIAPFPTADGNMLYYIARMGRRNWILGEMLFQFLAAVSYSIIIIGVTTAQTANISFLENGWSIPVMDYDKMGSMAEIHMGTLIPPNLFYQMPPYKALFLSYLLLAFFLFLSSMMFYDFSVRMFMWKEIVVSFYCCLTDCFGMRVVCYQKHVHVGSAFQPFGVEYPLPEVFSEICVFPLAVPGDIVCVTVVCWSNGVSESPESKP